MLKSETLLQNRYRVLDTIGQGGMGAVYLARDARLGNQVALKETFFVEENLRRAFEREARLLAGLRHVALPRVIDHFSEEAGQFLVMEFIAGDDLETLLNARRTAFPYADVMDWADQLLDALAYLHAQEPPVIHRDIKPQNLKLAGKQIILLDFGLAKGNAAGMTQTSGKSLHGYTPTYAPLEQIRDDGTGAQSDLYALGATLYHLLTGKAPADALLRAKAVIGGQPDPLRPLDEVSPDVPPAVAQVLQHALALHNEQRPASAVEMRELLRVARHSPAVSSTKKLPPPAQFAATMLDAPVIPNTSGDSVSAAFANPRRTAEAQAMATAFKPLTPLPRGDVRRDKPVAHLPAAQAAASPKSFRYAVSGVLGALLIGGAAWAFSGGADAPAPNADGTSAAATQEQAPIESPAQTAPNTTIPAAQNTLQPTNATAKTEAEFTAAGNKSSNPSAGNATNSNVPLANAPAAVETKPAPTDKTVAVNPTPAPTPAEISYPASRNLDGKMSQTRTLPATEKREPPPPAPQPQPPPPRYPYPPPPDGQYPPPPPRRGMPPPPPPGQRPL